MSRHASHRQPKPRNAELRTDDKNRILGRRARLARRIGAAAMIVSAGWGAYEYFVADTLPQTAMTTIHEKNPDGTIHDVRKRVHVDYGTRAGTANQEARLTDAGEAALGISVGALAFVIGGKKFRTAQTKPETRSAGEQDNAPDPTLPPVVANGGVPVQPAQASQAGQIAPATANTQPLPTQPPTAGQQYPQATNPSYGYGVAPSPYYPTYNTPSSQPDPNTQPGQFGPPNLF